MRNRTADIQKNAPITHCMTVHKKRIAIIYFIFILECQFSICAYLSRWRMRAFLTVYYQDILGLSDRLIIAAGNQQRSAGKAPAHKNTPNPNSESGGMKNQPLQNLVFFIGGAICLVHIFENHQTTYN